VLEHAFLKRQIKIDQYIAAQDDIDLTDSFHCGIIEKIQLPKADQFANLWPDPHRVSVEAKILLAQLGDGVSQTAFVVGSVNSDCDGALIQIGGENFKILAAKSCLALFKQHNRERVGLFTGGASCAPDAQAAFRFGRRGSQDPWKDTVANTVQLRLIAKKTGFTDCNFVQEAGQFSVADGMVRQS
jgi:hypothetical protein